MAPNRRRGETGQVKPRRPFASPSAPTREDIPAVVARIDYEKLRGVCKRALELLKSQCPGNEHVEVQANALLEELEKCP